MQNYRFDIKLRQRHFPDCKIIVEPVVLVQVFYTEDYKIDNIVLGVGGSIIGRVGNWDKVVREIEEVAAKVVSVLKPLPVPESEDIENWHWEREDDEFESGSMSREDKERAVDEYWERQIDCNR